MITRCLICNSSVVLSKDAAKALARLLGTLDGFLRGIQQSSAKLHDFRCEGPLEHAFNLMLDGICGAAANWNSTSDFIHDVRRFQFKEYDCLCLRCGAKYNEQPTPRS